MTNDEGMTQRRIGPLGGNSSWPPVDRGFTLIELMIVVAIIAVMISILIPSLSRARKQAQIVKCRSNLRQLTIAMDQHATENRGIYMALASDGSDSLEHIFPMYLRKVEVAVCPSTRNVIRLKKAIRGSTRSGGRGGATEDLTDLRGSARDARDDSGGHSYETWGWMNGPYIYPDGRLIDGNVQRTLSGLRVSDPPHILKTQRTVKKPFQTFIALDSDQGGGGRPGDWHNNYPDPLNNHGTAGLNMGFLDGHTEWVPAGRVGRTYRAGYSFDITDGSGSLRHAVTGKELDPGLSSITVRYGNRSYKQWVYNVGAGSRSGSTRAR